MSQHAPDLGEAPAFPVEEYAERAQRARVAMSIAHMDVALFFQPATVNYFTGFTTVNLSDPWCVVISLDGALYLILNELELARGSASLQFGEPVTYADQTSPASAVRSCISQHKMRCYGADTWALGLAPEWWLEVAEMLAPAAAVDARPILWATRLRKSEAELAVMRLSAAATDRGILAARDALVEGAADCELAAAGAAAMLRAGSEHFAMQPIVAAGPRAGVMHSEACGRRVTQGEAVLLEFGASIRRYTAPLMSTLVLGEPDERIMELGSLATRSLQECTRSLRPGAVCSEVAQKINDLVEREAPGIFYHRYPGYSVGLGYPPTWAEGLGFDIHPRNYGVVDKGMVFHLPVSLREPGKRGVGLSLTLAVTDTGSEALSNIEPALIIR